MKYTITLLFFGGLLSFESMECMNENSGSSEPNGPEKKVETKINCGSLNKRIEKIEPLNEKPIILTESDDTQERPFDEESIKPLPTGKPILRPQYRPQNIALPAPVLMNVYGFGKLSHKKKKTLLSVFSGGSQKSESRSGLGYFQDQTKQFGTGDVTDIIGKLQTTSLDANSLLQVLSGMNNNILDAISGSFGPVEQSVDGLKSSQPTTTNKVITEIARPAITTALVIGAWILCKYLKIF
ncbi:MAG: hypothetical protein UV38_C0003G0178 [candidate division TM6 bacterium GW2011_GWE2_42_60]|nr:MAG: hypothetical protein UV38_C0003G0178 [candidate division TM6 bacterium GW2011_GWE2_42_60]HBY05347.1 hypothetical protein [Candidatus Dependentiae bacterium]